MNKKSVSIYIIMIVVGISILFVAGKDNSDATRTENNVNVKIPETKKITIKVARAMKDIADRTILNNKDYQFDSIIVEEGSPEIADFSFHGIDGLQNYAISSSIKEGALIPTSSLIVPGSPNYIKMTLKSDMFFYPFYLDKSDNYLLDNIKVGDFVDVYLNYSVSVKQLGNNKIEKEISSPSRSLIQTRIKPIIAHRRVLAIDKAITSKQSNGIEVTHEGSRLFVELFDHEVKLVRSIDSNSKLLIFINKNKEQAEEKIIHAMTGDEAVWPVTNSEIFYFNQTSASNEQSSIVELRGN